jgi:GNAT-family acetyltransferase (TIGR03103 family)
MASETVNARPVKSAAARRASSPRARHRRLLPAESRGKTLKRNAVVGCGWGKLILAHTFADAESLAAAVTAEDRKERNIAFYVDDPHVVLAAAPQRLFLDPSHTYRLWLAHYRTKKQSARGFFIRRLRQKEEADAINSILARVGMVQIPAEFLLKTHNSRTFTILVAVDETSGAVVGTVMGLDHVRAFGDPEDGSSLWSLAVDPQSAPPGVGEALVRHLAEHFQTRGRSFLDLSVMHTNKAAIKLYETLGFQRVPVFAVKHKNPINEKLYIAPEPEAKLNPYARIIIDEARRRGIGVEIEDEESALFRLSLGGRTIACRESLSELTTSVAMSRCDDKALTRRILHRNDIAVPDQTEADGTDADAGFLALHGSVVVKPARGEQGRGISVDIREPEALSHAVDAARQHCDRVLIEEYRRGEDLRVIVIGGHVVAGAIRRPATIRGNGRSTVAELIAVQSRRRAAATGGESRIPLDAETERCVAAAGLAMDTVPEEGRTVAVRRTANLHTGGTIHDVTDHLHPALTDASIRAARALDIPVVGLDLIVRTPRDPDYVIIEANERPGLANQEPQPTAERFIDLLFPQTIR